MSVAEFRGPGVRHQFDQDSPDDYELDVPRYQGGRNGRIILLGDGTEVLTDSTDDAEMFDHSMEDEQDEQDEESQMKKGASAAGENDSARKDREGTPGPQSEAEKQHMKHSSVSQGPGTSIQGIADDPDNKK